MKNSSLFAGAFLAAVTLAADPAQAQRSPPIVDPNGIAHCDGLGDNRASNGEMPTDFANRYWSHLGCGLWPEAMEVLNTAPKVWERAILPTVEMRDAGNPIAICYFDSFAYGPSYHARRESESGRTEVKHGFYVLPEYMFHDVEQAALFACQPKDLS